MLPAVIGVLPALKESKASSLMFESRQFVSSPLKNDEINAQTRHSMKNDDIDWLRYQLFDLTKALKGYRGSRYLAALVLALTRVLRVRHVFVGQAIDNTSVNALFFADRSNLQKPFTYQLAGTACIQVIQGTPMLVPCDLSKKYPAHAGMDSYVGLPLKTPEGKVIGLLSLMDEGALVGENRIAELFALIVDRVATELQYVAYESAENK